MDSELREVDDHSDWYSEGENFYGTRYILQLDVFADRSDPDADVRKVWNLLGDSFNIPHDLKIIAQEKE